MIEITSKVAENLSKFSTVYLGMECIPTYYSTLSINVEEHFRLVLEEYKEHHRSSLDPKYFSEEDIEEYVREKVWELKD